MRSVPKIRFQLFVIAFLAALVHGITLVGAQKKDCECEKRPQGPKTQIISAVENCDVETVTSLIRNGVRPSKTITRSGTFDPDSI